MKERRWDVPGSLIIARRQPFCCFCGALSLEILERRQVRGETREDHRCLSCRLITTLVVEEVEISEAEELSRTGARRLLGAIFEDRPEVQDALLEVLEAEASVPLLRGGMDPEELLEAAPDGMLAFPSATVDPPAPRLDPFTLEVSMGTQRALEGLRLVREFFERLNGRRQDRDA